MRHHQHVTIWKPETEQNLRSVLETGDAAENHFLDFKREIGDTDSSRKETARDMASFAISGGTLIFGVGEDTPGIFELAPFSLVGASERIEQIAANRIDPSLHIRTREIQSAEAGLGYLVVEIPPSVNAPHMVASQYWGRAEKTKRRLTDAEVVRLHAVREAAEDRGMAALNEELSREPAPHDDRRGYLVAIPLLAPRSAAKSFVRGGDTQAWGFATESQANVPATLRLSSLQPEYMTRTEVRARGIARTTMLGGGRTSAANQLDDNYILDLEVQEDGSIRILLGGTIHDVVSAGQPLTVISEGNPIGWAYRLMAYAENLAKRIAYTGPWALAIHLGGLKGISSTYSTTSLHSLPKYSEPTYENVVVANHGELEDHKAELAERLLGRFVAGLGTSEMWAEVLGSSDMPDDRQTSE